jgi:hypothetical protein
MAAIQPCSSARTGVFSRPFLPAAARSGILPNSCPISITVLPRFLLARTYSTQNTRYLYLCPFLSAHVTINFNMSTAAVSLDIEKAFDTTWQPGLLYKLSKLQLSVNLIKFISSYLSHRKFRVSVGSKLSTPRDIEARVPQSSVLAPTLYSLYINDTPQTPGVQLAAFARDTCMYVCMYVCMQQNARRGMFSENCNGGVV